ncbi:hypothetical protein [Thermococcus sp.]
MKLPSVKPSEENVLCKDKEEFGRLIKRTIERSGSGAFFKVLGKSEDGAYYATVLIDDEKILAIEIQDVKEGTTLVGRPAMEFLDEILQSGPVIADAFPLKDVDVKMSVVENIEVYNSTPKLHLSEFCPAFRKGAVSTERPSEKFTTSSANEIQKSLEEPKPKHKAKSRTKVNLDVPTQLEPYFRALSTHVTKYAKTLGIEISEVKIDAKEVRYALGAGTGIHATVELKGSSKTPVSPMSLKQSLESFVYKEAGELSKEIGKKVVINNFSLKL